MTRKAITPDRLRRAADRAIKQVGPRQFVVAGTEQPEYYVDLDEETPCYCHDAWFKGQSVMCLHEIAARLAAREPSMVDALTEEYVKVVRNAREAGLPL